MEKLTSKPNTAASSRHHGGVKGATPVDSGDGFRDYIRNKIEKQRREFGVIGEQQQQTSLLCGVVCLINGYTNPDRDELTRMIQKHGGAVEMYETSIVTHIIAQQLSVAKMKAYRKQKKPVPVVTPAFVLASIEMGRLLPHDKFLLSGLVNNDNQTIITSAYTAHHNVSTPPQPSTPYMAEVGMTGTNSGGDNRCATSPCQTSMINTAGVVKTVSTDPFFLEDYFRNSRLSYIGSYRQRATPSSALVASKSQQALSSTTTVRYVFHIDMDSFFASVVLRRYPQFKDKPVVISHGSSTNAGNKSSKFSTSECATCNYEARKYGIQKGMFLGDAKKLCPDVIVLPYDFDGYEEVSNRASEIVYSYAEGYNGTVEQVSCDEFYSEMYFPETAPVSSENDTGTSYLTENIKHVHAHDESARATAEKIRMEIFTETECTVTVGAAKNKFLAKVATNKAKPNKCLIVAEEGEEMELLKQLDLRDIPGIGPKSEKLLELHDLKTVNDIWDLGERQLSEQILTNILGNKNGIKLVEFCCGEDSRTLVPARRKTIGAECNYGVRFDGPYGVEHMIRGLAKEVERRMEAAAVRGKQMTMKIKKRKEGEGKAFKYLGHGRCYNLSKSCDITGVAVRECDAIARLGVLLLHELKVEKTDIRGMGIVISKLVEDDTSNIVVPSIMQTWLQSKPRAWKADDDVVEVLSEDQSHVAGRKNADGEEPIASKRLLISNTYGNENIFMDDIEIPPMSQIDRNEIDAMPQPLRDRILQKLAEHDKQKGCTSSERLYTGQSISSPAPKKNLLLPPNPPRPEDKKRKTTATSSLVLRKGKRHQHQLSVKRMLVLASIKSGKDAMKVDGEPVSLTQLCALPLAVQLQVANKDELSLQSTYSSCNNSQQHLKRRKKIWPNNEGALDYSASDACYSTPTKKATTNKLLDITSPTLMVPVLVLEETNYLKDDVIFLQKWLDSHSPNSADDFPPTAITQLTEFLCVCMEEKRLEHVIIFLRMVKYRQDNWGGESAYYQSLLDNVRNHLKSRYCVNLDTEWHGL